VDLQCSYHGKESLLAVRAAPLGHICTWKLVGQPHSLTPSLHCEGYCHLALLLQVEADPATGREGTVSMHM